MNVKCNICNGTGLAHSRKCYWCNGFGRTKGNTDIKAMDAAYYKSLPKSSIVCKVPPAEQRVKGIEVTYLDFYPLEFQK